MTPNSRTLFWWTRAVSMIPRTLVPVFCVMFLTGLMKCKVIPITYISSEIGKPCLSCQTNILLSAILCFHRISDNRVAANHITVDPLKHLFMFRKLCGNEAESRIVLTTTMWDEVQETVGKNRLVELESTHWKTMIERGSTTFRYWNTQESARELLQMVAEQTVQRRGIQSSLS